MSSKSRHHRPVRTPVIQRPFVRVTGLIAVVALVLVILVPAVLSGLA